MVPYGKSIKSNNQSNETQSGGVKFHFFHAHLALIVLGNSNAGEKIAILNVRKWAT